MAEEILKLIDEDEDIGILTLAAGTGKEGPGPLVTNLGKTAGSFPIPVAIVPGHLSDEELDAPSSPHSKKGAKKKGVLGSAFREVSVFWVLKPPGGWGLPRRLCVFCFGRGSLHPLKRLDFIFGQALRRGGLCEGRESARAGKGFA